MEEQKQKKHSPHENKTKKEDFEAIKLQAQEYLDNWKRERADFLNYKKDEDKRVAEIVKYSGEGMILEMVEVMDNFIATMKHMPNEIKEKNKDWVEGLEKAISDFEKMLKGYGVERILVDGTTFDPMLHEAVEMADKDGQRLEEVRAGYKLHDKVIRSARVKIVK